MTGMLIGEVIARTMHLTSDIPRRTIDQNYIQKYLPGQKGYWKGGDHSWSINEMGWPGKLPNSFDNLQVIIGDSFIENFMNPPECHQSIFLKEKIPELNFMEAARSGVSLIEAMEIAKQLDSLQPENYFLYVKNEDFIESIKEIKALKDITQVSLVNQKIIHGEMKSPGLKRILYNWKFLYYLYNRFPIGRGTNNEQSLKEPDAPLVLDSKIPELLHFIKKNYRITNKIFVFMPNTDKVIIEAVEEAGFRSIKLNDDGDKNWSFEHDSHWTCYGHERAASQVAKMIKKTTY
ncbi:hypothetical protein [Ascidiimonas sp. W6]|uniref:hypothetical protein n=1 Tax=Ascidiimonas meishanensis TaxID=3128903 RepID=UPI0030ED487B